MSLPLTRPQARALDTALRDRETIASRSEYAITVSGEDYTYLLKDHSHGAGDGPAMVLEATLAARISEGLGEDLEGEPVLLEQYVDGVPFRVFTGEIVAVDLSERGYTGLSCASTSTHLEKTPLSASLTEFNNSEPRNALYEVLSLLPYASLDIAPITEEVFTRTTATGDPFTWLNKISEVAEAIREDTGLTFFDDGHGVVRGYLEDSLTRATEPLVELEAGVDLVDYEHSTRYRERYSEVRVYFTPESGAPMLLASVGTGIKNVGDRPLDLEASDSDALKAHDRAFREALAIQTDHREASFRLLYPLPHLTRTDTLAITEVERGVRKGRPGRWKRRYLLRVTAFDADEAKGMDVSGVQRMASEEFLEEPQAVSLSLVAGPVMPPLGKDYLGDPYVSDALPWVSYDGATGEAVLDVSAAADAGFNVYEESGEIVVEQAT